MNPHRKALAWIHIALWAPLLAIGLIICLGLLFSRDPGSERALWTIGMPFMFLSAMYFIPGVVGGIGLLGGKPWARTVLIVVSVLLLFFLPVGTALGAYGLWVLRASQWKSTGEPEAKPQPTPPWSPKTGALAPLSAEQKARYAGLLLAGVGVASAFIVAIGTGFRVTHQPAPAPIGELYYTAIVLLIAVITTAVVMVARSGWRPTMPLHVQSVNPVARQKLAAERRQAEAERAARLAALAADPVRRKYVELIERGEYWSDAQIDYNEDLNAVATCVHLQPIEHAMRLSGIAVKLLWNDHSVHADCCVDHVALSTRFALPASVRYSEPSNYQRSLEDPPLAIISCDVCQSVIDCVNRSSSTPATIWFPAA